MDGVPEIRKEQVMALSTQLYAATRAREDELEAEEERQAYEAEEAGGPGRLRTDSGSERRAPARNTSNTIRVSGTPDK
jgi:hypothetical protein